MANAPQGDYLLLIDASSYIHRAFHALPRVTRRADGMQTGALAGLCYSLLKLLVLNWTSINRLPSHAAMVMDTRGKNFRHEIFPDYKAQRKPYEADLEAQLPWIAPIAEAFDLPSIGMSGYEADDIIATLVRMAEAEKLDVVIASSDKDLSQLVSTRTIMYDAMKDKGREDNEGCLIGVEEVKAKYDVFPWQMVDLQAIVGDTVDNVPGLFNFGPKTAARLLNTIGDLDEIMIEADFDGARFKTPKEHKAVLEGQESLKLSRQLVQLDQFVPVGIEIDDLYLKPVNRMKLRSLFIDLEFMHLVNKV
jgi:DNA polymerase-1